jgi:protein-S-isoprenylcysteine O-methyltransferase Ste14
MRRAAIGTVVFFFLAPGTVGGLIPWLLGGDSRYDGSFGVTDVLGDALFVVGLLLVIAAFVQFVREGRGTPAPVAPTEELVVGGLYRYIRNPMYVAVGAMIAGQALIYSSAAVWWWLLAFAGLVASFVRLYEEPTLRRTYGASYEAYLAAVPGWWPRLTPWRGGPGGR